MFRNYNEAALRCILYAQEEATYTKKKHIGALEIIIGILKQVDEPLPRFLRRNYKFTIQKVEKLLNAYRTDCDRGSIFLEKVKIIISTDLVKNFVTKFSVFSEFSLYAAEAERKRFGHRKIGLEHLFLGLLQRKNPELLNFLQIFNVNEKALKEFIFEEMIDMPTGEILVNPHKLVEINLKYFDQVMGEINSPLPSMSENYTRLAYTEHFNNIMGRQAEVDEMMEILLKKHNNCPILVGPKGIGKNSVVQSFANQIALKEVPDLLKGKIILRPDLNFLQANCRTRGEYESRLRSYLADSRADTNILLYLASIERMIGTNDSSYEGLISDMSTSLILRTILLHETFCFIGSTTKRNFNQYIKRDTEFRNSIRPIYLNELSVKATYQILKTLKYPYQSFHLVEFSPSSIFTAIEYSQKFIKNKYFPTKALEILDEAAAYVKFKKSKVPAALKKLIDEKIYLTTILKKEYNNNLLSKNYLVNLKRKLQLITSRIRVLKNSYFKEKNKKAENIEWVTDSDIREVMSRLLDTPLTNSDSDDSAKFLKMEEIIHTKIIGQETAVEAVSRAIRRARVGFSGQKRPIASFIFAGPTGVGKTELTKVLSEYMFDNSKSMIRLDMSEYMEKHTIAKLIGSPPGYIGHNEGGQLTEAVSAKPYSIVLFDEVEKAHPEVFNLLLQILDDGRLTDSQGQIVSFVNTVIILTTNLGAKEADLQKSKNTNLTVEQIEKVVKKQLRGFFKPEFINRIDEIIVFRSLTYKDLSKICYLMVKELKKSFLEQKVILKVDAASHTFLTKHGFDPVYGARPLRRSITRYLIDPLSELFLGNGEMKNAKIVVSALPNAKKLNISVETTINNRETKKKKPLGFKPKIIKRFFKKCNTSKKPNIYSNKQSPLIIRLLTLLRSNLKTTRLEKEILIDFLSQKDLANQINIKKYFDYYNY
uniref:ATP-dependent clp protease ATP-binding subunit n=1 Tax=Nitzschia sp. IriIs04 TaxID=1444690 RepID=A0A0S3QPH6_9STRA|nr:ATP-dependent clp protease ATP-binding subunit [Nitzschia sp. IriIs04]YP_009193358.1 ATP-dependent clp protease ATP-binding subunit [Nitzschia sp. IriIs04]BAT70247.1 ATP-dependent clp protease ATP-binding subunit [Nitzschia sp. IriIs04]BAT70283.1 ATP-dependent clp protease ATP-binding subunit [Nitzschia sp. IriIs04]